MRGRLPRALESRGGAAPPRGRNHLTVCPSPSSARGCAPPTPHPGGARAARRSGPTHPPSDFLSVGGSASTPPARIARRPPRGRPAPSPWGERAGVRGGLPRALESRGGAAPPRGADPPASCPSPSSVGGAAPHTPIPEERAHGRVVDARDTSQGRSGPTHPPSDVLSVGAEPPRPRPDRPPAATRPSRSRSLGREGGGEGRSLSCGGPCGVSPRPVKPPRRPRPNRPPGRREGGAWAHRHDHEQLRPCRSLAQHEAVCLVDHWWQGPARVLHRCRRVRVRAPASTDRAARRGGGAAGCGGRRCSVASRRR